MHRSSKDTTENNPQIGCRSKKDSHDGTEDGACAGNVQKLDEEDFPSGHGYVIHSVSLGITWCLAIRVNTKNLFHKSAIDNVS